MINNDRPGMFIISLYTGNTSQLVILVSACARSNNNYAVNAKAIFGTVSSSGVTIGYDGNRDFFVRKSNGLVIGTITVISDKGFTLNVEITNSATFTEVTIG